MRVKLNTLELQPGDVIHYYGLEIAVGEVTLHDAPVGTLATSQGTILNRDEVLNSSQTIIPRGWVAAGFWPIQGTERATWDVERAV